MSLRFCPKFLVLNRTDPRIRQTHLGIRLALVTPESGQEKFVRERWDVFRVENLAMEGFLNVVH